MFARIIFLVGSVFTLFGVWKFISPVIYQNIAAEPRQGLVFLISGIVLILVGRYLEKQDSGNP